MKQLQSTLLLHETVCNMSRPPYGAPNSAALGAAAAAAAAASASVSVSGGAPVSPVLGGGLGALGRSLNPQSQRSPPMPTPLAHSLAIPPALPHALPHSLGPAHPHYAGHFGAVAFPHARGLASGGPDLEPGRVGREANAALATSFASSALSGQPLGPTGSGLSDPGMLLVGAPRVALQRAHARAQQGPASSSPLLNVRPRNLY